jgi:hypothetical protein
MYVYAMYAVYSICMNVCMLCMYAMYVCMNVCMHICMLCKHVCIYACIYAMYVCIYVCMYVYMYAMFVCMYVYMYAMHVCMLCMYAMYVCMHASWMYAMYVCALCTYAYTCILRLYVFMLFTYDETEDGSFSAVYFFIKILFKTNRFYKNDYSNKGTKHKTPNIHYHMSIYMYLNT